jgi:hypothetical protein
MKGKKNTTRNKTFFVRFLTVFLGFALGVALFMPWEKICVRLVEYVDAKLVNTRFTWTDLRRAGPSGFRLDGLVVSFANAPGSMFFEHADLRFGFSPLARVRLNTGGSECYVSVDTEGRLKVEGQVNLTFLFGRSELGGLVHVKGRIIPTSDGRLLGSGWFDLRAPRLVLPDGTLCSEVSATVEMNEHQWNIKNFSQKQPVDYQGKGVMELDPDSVPRSVVRLDGELIVGGRPHAYDVEGTLHDLLAGPRH